MSSYTLLTPQQGTPHNPPRQVAADDVPIRVIAGGMVGITKAGVAALTLADPAKDVNAILVITSETANAHTVTYASGFGGVGAGADVATWGGAAGDTLTLIASGGFWNIMSLYNVTVA